MSDTSYTERRRRRFETATETAPEPAPAGPVPGEPAPAEPASEWLPIDEIALSGRPVYVRGPIALITDPDAESGAWLEAEAVYRNSRRFNSARLKWEGHGFWALRNASGSILPFEPTAYRVIE